jgi:hypothetical protein
MADFGLSVGGQVRHEDPVELEAAPRLGVLHLHALGRDRLPVGRASVNRHKATRRAAGPEGGVGRGHPDDVPRIQREDE